MKPCLFFLPHRHLPHSLDCLCLSVLDWRVSSFFSVSPLSRPCSFYTVFMLLTSKPIITAEAHDLSPHGGQWPTVLTSCVCRRVVSLPSPFSLQ